jgi:hypothetical protein
MMKGTRLISINAPIDIKNIAAISLNGTVITLVIEELLDSAIILLPEKHQ